MAKITIAAGDLISNSRADINSNFTELYDDKIATSVLDTDTALTANSDSKIATQKAVKAYVDTGGNVNASTITRGIVEEATQAEVDAGTAAGATSARLFVNPSATQFTTTIPAFTTAFKYTVGALNNALAKTYFNVQLLFVLWDGSVVNDTTTTHANWAVTSDVTALPGGAMASFAGTGAESIDLAPPFLKVSTAANMTFNDGRIAVLDWWAILPATSTGDINMGFGDAAAAYQTVFDSTVNDKVTFSQKSTGELYATVANSALGVTNTDISSGYTATVWNNFRIEFDSGNNALFYINGTLKATLSGANLPDSGNFGVGFGRSDTGSFIVTAPTLSLQMNP